MSDEAIRAGVSRLKQLAQTRIPPYELPADSFLEQAVRDVLAIRVPPMDEARAREILKNDRWPDDHLGGQGIMWYPEQPHFAMIDAQMDVDMLEAVAWWMRNKVANLAKGLER